MQPALLRLNLALIQRGDKGQLYKLVVGWQTQTGWVGTGRLTEPKTSPRSLGSVAGGATFDDNTGHSA